jgi:hypothetical protein
LTKLFQKKISEKRPFSILMPEQSDRRNLKGGLKLLGAEIIKGSRKNSRLQVAKGNGHVRMKAMVTRKGEGKGFPYPFFQVLLKMLQGLIGYHIYIDHPGWKTGKSR